MASLGDTLRNRRSELGRSVLQAEEATKIRGRLIEALENGEYERLPNAAYVRGYIISYARWLELDPAPLLTMYRAESGSVGPTSAVPRRETVVPPREKAHAVPWRAAVVIAVVLLAILAGVWGFGALRRGASDSPPPIPSEPEPTATPGASDAAAGASATPTATPTPAPDLTPSAVPFTLKVAVSQNGASWLRITVDGEKAYEGTLVGSQSKEYEVTGEATVLVGRPSVVSITRDGKEVPIPPSSNTPSVKLTASEAP